MKALVLLIVLFSGVAQAADDVQVTSELVGAYIAPYLNKDKDKDKDKDKGYTINAKVEGSERDCLVTFNPFDQGTWSLQLTPANFNRNTEPYSGQCDDMQNCVQVNTWQSISYQVSPDQKTLTLRIRQTANNEDAAPIEVRNMTLAITRENNGQARIFISKTFGFNKTTVSSACITK